MPVRSEENWVDEVDGEGRGTGREIRMSVFERNPQIAEVRKALAPSLSAGVMRPGVESSVGTGQARSSRTNFAPDGTATPGNKHDVVDPPIDFDQLTKLFTLDNDFRLCVEAIQGKVVGQSFKLYPKRKKSNPSPMQKQQMEDWLEELSHDARDPSSEFLGPGDHIAAAIADWALTAQGYLEVVRDMTGKPVGLYHVPSKQVRRRRKKDGYVQFKSGAPSGSGIASGDEKAVYYKNFGDMGLRLDPINEDEMTEIIHLHFPNPDNDYYGAPQVPLIKYALLDKYGLDFNINQHEKGGMPSYVVTVTGGNLSKASIKRIEAFIDKEVAGNVNSNRMLLLEGLDEGVQINIQPVGASIKDMEYGKLHELARDEKIRGFRVPPYKVGIKELGTGAGQATKSQNETFKYDVVEPMQSRIERMLNVLAKQAGFTDWEIKLDELDIKDEKETADIVATYAKIPGIRMSEIREIAGLKKTTINDFYMIPRGYRATTDVEFDQLFLARQQAIDDGQDPLMVLGDVPPNPLAALAAGAAGGTPGPATGSAQPGKTSTPSSTPGQKPKTSGGGE